MGTSADAEQYGFSPGDVIDGKYRVDTVLGTGGMAVVWAAHHLQLDERVAIKVLRRECADSAEALARFRREARAAVKIKGEHVARVMDVGALPDGTPYMVMEHLDGLDLSQRLRGSGPLEPQLAAEFLLQAAEALAEAHALGIVHRDLKPANLFVTRRPDGSPRVKVLDFGISKHSPGLGTSSITQGTALVGTPLYMSPEQLKVSKQIDARTDIWGLGVILYESLTGEPPFTAETMPEVVHLITSGEPIPPRVLRPAIPAGLEAVVTRCLAKDREGRFPNVAAFARALAPFAAEHARVSSERVAYIIESSQRASALAVPTPDAAQSGTRPALRFWPHATTITGKRALGVGMIASALLGSAALFWAHQHVVAPPAAELESEPPPVLAPLAPAPRLAAPAPAPAPAAPATLAAPPSVPAGIMPPPQIDPGAHRPRSARPRAPVAATPAPPLAAAAPESSPAAQTAVPAVPVEPAPALAREPASARDRDASVKAMGDDLRPLLDEPRRQRGLEDPFR